VVEELPTPVRNEILAQLAAIAPAAAEAKAPAPIVEKLSETERAVFSILKVDEARHVDELVEASELSSSDVLAALFELEMKELVRQLPGKYFLRVLPPAS